MVMNNYFPDIKIEMLIDHKLHADGSNNPVSLI